MRQQINLYQPILRRQRKVFSAVTMVQIVLAIALGLAAIYAFGHWQSAALERDVAELEAQRHTAQSRFDTLGREVSARRDDQSLQEQIRLAQAEVEAQRHLLQRLGERDRHRPAGFAAHLAGLARQHRPGLWLSEIRIAEGGRSVTLAGDTRDPAGLVRYLRRLGNEAAFRGIEFRTVRIERAEAEPTTARFLVASDVVEEETP